MVIPPSDFIDKYKTAYRFNSFYDIDEWINFFTIETNFTPWTRVGNRLNY